MTALRKPKAWNLKPQLTAAPEFWRGVTLVIPMWEGIGAAFNIGSSKNIQNSPESGFYSWSTTEAGRGIKLPGNSTIRYQDAAQAFSNIGATEFTAVSVHKASSIPNDEGLFTSRRSQGDSNSAFLRYDASGFSSGGSNMLKFGMGSTDGSVVGEAGGGTQTTDVQHIVLRWRSGNRPELFVDGAKQTAEAVPDVLGGTLGGSTFFGWFLAADINGGNWSGDILLSVASTAYWSDDEIAKHARDPFAMLRPAGF